MALSIVDKSLTLGMESYFSLLDFGIRIGDRRRNDFIAIASIASIFMGNVIGIAEIHGILFRIGSR